MNYQVIQDKKGLLTFHIQQKMSEKEKDYLSDEIRHYFNDDIDFILIDNSLPKDISKKSTSFVSNLPK